MDYKAFPRTDVGGVSLPRMIVGTNWILGYGHRTPSSDTLIKGRNLNRIAVCEIMEVFLRHDIDAIMGPISASAALRDGLSDAEQKAGKAIHRVDTPIVNVNDSQADRTEAAAQLKAVKDAGAEFCLIHHACAEQLVNKNKRTIDRLPDYLTMIRDEGMIPGLSAHMPELIVYSDDNGYDVETYIQIYNAAGFLMQVEIEYIHSVIVNAKKPVMTIKPMAAGRMTPFVGLNFVWNTLRDCDMVTVGCFTPDEAEEDIEYSFAALERRPPNLAGRDSPAKAAQVIGSIDKV